MSEFKVFMVKKFLIFNVNIGKFVIMCSKSLPKNFVSSYGWFYQLIKIFCFLINKWSVN